MKLMMISLKKITHELKSSRSSGHDGLNSELVKLISNDISNAITIIVNQSIKSGIFPTKLKIAKVTLIRSYKLTIDQYQCCLQFLKY